MKTRSGISLRNVWHGLTGTIALASLLTVEALTAAPSFTTWRDDPSFYRPTEPLVFIASYRHATINNGGNFGTDVLEAGAPSHGQELWILNVDGTTERLFPIPGIHESIVDVDPFSTQPIIGSVTEPSISIDGRRVYFTYFHDAKTFPPFCCGTTGHSNFDGWPAGGGCVRVCRNSSLS